MTQYFRLLLAVTKICHTTAFLHAAQPNGFAPIHTSTARFMGRKVKPSMPDRRERKTGRTSVPTLETDRSVEAAVSKPPPPSPTAEAVGSSGKKTLNEAEEMKKRASSILESQRKSVDCLTFIRRRVEEIFPVTAAVESISNQGYFVYDGFLSSSSDTNESADKDRTFGDRLLTEMFQEGIDMLSEDKLERDITRLCDGEFVGLITGGEKYNDCPRLTEYVVSMTRHLPPLLDGIGTKLSSTASMGSVRMCDRKTKLGTASLLASENSDDKSVDRPFGVICENDGEGATNDLRRITAILFVSSKNWDPSTCGGGITMESGLTVGAVRDRLVLLRSDTCSHRQDPWTGSDGEDLQQSGCVTLNFVKG